MPGRALIVIGAILFLCMLAIPTWYICSSGKVAAKPEPKIPEEIKEKECIEPKGWMRKNHPDLLNNWREMVIRKGERTYVASDGEKFNISLVGSSEALAEPKPVTTDEIKAESCLDCHSNKEEFCTRCHVYSGVQPNCWGCHRLPKGE